MIYDVFKPSKKLEKVIKQYVVISSLEGVEKLLFLPNGCNFIVFNRGVKGYTKDYKKEGTLPLPTNYSISLKTNKVRYFVLGEENSHHEVPYPLILAELNPVGYYKLFNKSARELKSNFEVLQEDIVQKYFNDLYTHSSIEAELEYLNSSFEEIEASQDSQDLKIYDVIDKIVNTYRYEVTVDKLAKDFRCSRSTLERDFKKVVGLTPKNFIFVAKFCKTALAYIGDDCTFKELEYLYTDNSHLNTVFKKFLGMSPSAIVKEVMEKNIRIYQVQNLKKTVSNR